MLSHIRESIANALLQIPNTKDIELEARFGYYRGDTFISGIPKINFYRLLDFLRSSYNSEKIVISSVTQDGPVRRIVWFSDEETQRDKITWEHKSQITQFSLPDYNLNISLNSELQLEHPPINFNSTLSRERTRYTFNLLDGLYQIDMTEVLMSIHDNIEIVYEVELEYHGDVATVDSLEQTIEYIYKVLYSTHNIYTNKEKYDTLEPLNFNNSQILAKPRHLKLVDMATGGIVGGEKSPYTASFKPIGTRKLLVVNSTGIWLIYPPYEYNLVSRGLYSTQTYIFDCDVTANGDIYISDCLLYDNQDVRYLSYQERYQSCNDFLNTSENSNILDDSIYIRQFIVLENTTINGDILKDLLNFYESRYTLPYDTDCIIFKPLNGKYNYNDSINTDTSLAVHPSICKFEFNNYITIDFAIKQELDNKIGLYVTEDNSDKLIRFVGTTTEPFDESMIDHANELTKNLNSGSVVEYLWSDNKLIPYKIRDDKASPNTVSIANDNWNTIMNPLDIENIIDQNKELLGSYIFKTIENTIAKYSFSKDKLFILNLSRDDFKYIFGNRENKYTPFGTFSNINGITDNIQDKVIGKTVDIIISNPASYNSSILNLNPKCVMLITSSADNLTTINSQLINFGYKLDAPIHFTSEKLLSRKSVFISENLQLIVYYLPNNNNFLDIKNDNMTNKFELLPDVTLFPLQSSLQPSLQSSLRPLSKLPPLMPLSKLPQLSALTPINRKYDIIDDDDDDEDEDEDEDEEDNNILPMLGVYYMQGTKIVKGKAINDDTYEPINCTWYNDIIRIATIGDGSCFIHALLKSLYIPYQNTAGAEFRINLTQRFRRDLAMKLAHPNPKYEGWTYWETAGNGAFPRLLMQTLSNEDLVNEVDTRDNFLDYSLKSLEVLFNSASILGDELYSFISDILNVDVYVMQGTTTDLLVNTHTVFSNEFRQGIVIMGNTYHWEVIGLDTPEGIQTIFEPYDEFLIAIRSKFGEGGELSIINYDPVDAFIEDYINAFGENLDDNIVFERFTNADDIFLKKVIQLRPFIQARFIAE